MTEPGRKSILGCASEIVHSETNNADEPWWKDTERVVKKALSSECRKSLISGLVDLASNDEAFRRQMFSKFEALGSGKKASPGRPFWWKVMLVHQVEVYRQSLQQEGKPHSVTDVCEILAPLATFQISPKRFETLYYKYKKDPEIIETLVR